MRTYFSIGEISNITGFTINALRHYDKIGLCRPAIVNEKTNYRYYDESQLFIFDIIRFAKKIDLSLDELSEILNQHTMTSFNEFLEVLKQRMADKINLLNSNIVDLEHIQERVSTSEYLTGIESLYQREIGTRTIVVSPNLPSSVNNRYTKQRELLEEEIQKSNMSPTFESGNVYRLGKNTFQQVGIYKTVSIEYNTDSDLIMSLPRGNYLCVNYTLENRQQAWEMIQESMANLHLSNPVIIESLLLNDIFEKDNARYELQIYTGEQEV